MQAQLSELSITLPDSINGWYQQDEKEYGQGSQYFTGALIY